MNAEAIDFDKKCQRCKKEKNCKDFGARKSSVDGFKGTCKRCVTEMSTVRYAKNPEKAAAYYVKNKERIHKYRESNKERDLAKQRHYNKENYLDKRAWVKANPDKVRLARKRYRSKPENRKKANEAKKKWVAKNAESVRKTRQGNYLKYKDIIRERAQAWRKKNADLIRVKNRNRKIRLKSIEGIHSKKDIDKLFNNQRGKCIVCLKPLLDAYHVDHIMPISRGGSNWPENLQLLCPPCNMSKNNKDPIEFMQSRGFLI